MKYWAFCLFQHFRMVIFPPTKLFRCSLQNFILIQHFPLSIFFEACYFYSRNSTAGSVLPIYSYIYGKLCVGRKIEYSGIINGNICSINSICKMKNQGSANTRTRYDTRTKSGINTSNYSIILKRLGSL